MVGDGELGTRLRTARLARGVSLRSVAGQAGISASLLSQVENGKTQPSVGTLYAIVSYLDISIDALLGNVPTGSDNPGTVGSRRPDVVQAREDAPRIEMQNGVTWERLAVGPFAHVDPLHTTYAPAAASGVDGRFMRHTGVEYGYIIEGELTLKLEFESFTVRAGDSLCFDSQRPHLYVNESDAPVRGLFFVVDSALHDAGAGLPTRTEIRTGDRPPTSAVDALDAVGRRTGAQLS